MPTLFIPAACLSMAFIVRAHLRSSYEDAFSAFTFVYMVWIITTSWVSEQNVETLLVLCLFQGAASAFDRRRRWFYGLVSVVVLGFVVFNVPATSFLYPVYEVDGTQLSLVGKFALPWIAIAFALCIGVELFRTGSKTRSKPSLGRIRSPE